MSLPIEIEELLKKIKQDARASYEKARKSKKYYKRVWENQIVNRTTYIP